MGNLDSVARAVEECGGRPIVTSDADEIRRATAIILPGVGSFSAGMRNIRDLGLEEVLTEQVVGKGVPFLGLCLGMQLLARSGCEGGETPGLGWIDAEIRRLEPHDPSERVPHVGWNEVYPEQATPLLEGMDTPKDFYFVHSYHMVCGTRGCVIATTPYCGGFVSAVRRENLFGVQFHPEKSQKAGFHVLGNFLGI